MPTASIAKKTTTPRKRRTRKTTSTPLNKTVAKPIVAEVREVKVSDTPEVSQPVVKESVQVRPAQPNLKWEDYRDDIKIRWEIHQWETKELWEDSVKLYQSVKPVVIKTIDYVKDSYDRAFNQEEEKETT